MRILAINGSPRGRQGNTEVILQAFLEGARSAGAEAEVVYLKEKTIRHCTGCFTCWTKTPGVCIHQDDMPALLERVIEARILVFATPLYVFTVSGLMKDFMDRLIPLALPHIVRRGHHYIHPMRRPDVWPKKVVLISNCGFPEPHHFSGLEETFLRFADSPDLEWAGSVLCAGGELLRSPLRERMGWYLDAARQAGAEVVERGEILPETRAVLSRPLIADPAVYARMANAYWRSLGVEPPPSQATTRSDAPQARLLLPPRSLDTVRDAVAGMAVAFRPEEAGDLKAVIQFEVEGEEPGRYYLLIADGQCAAYEGEHPAPTLTIRTPAEVWLGIVRGEVNGAQAMMEGRYAVEGDLGLLMRFGRLFSGRHRNRIEVEE